MFKLETDRYLKHKIIAECGGWSPRDWERRVLAGLSGGLRRAWCPKARTRLPQADREDLGCIEANPGALSPTVCPAAHTATWGSGADRRGSLGTVTLTSGQCCLRIAAVQPHRWWRHVGRVWPSLPGPQLLPVARALTLLERTGFLGEEGRLVARTTRVGRPGLWAGRSGLQEGGGVGERQASPSVCPPSPDSGRAGWLGGRLESRPVLGTQACMCPTR